VSSSLPTTNLPNAAPTVLPRPAPRSIFISTRKDLLAATALVCIQGRPHGSSRTTSKVAAWPRAWRRVTNRVMIAAHSDGRQRTSADLSQQFRAEMRKHECLSEFPGTEAIEVSGRTARPVLTWAATRRPYSSAAPCVSGGLSLGGSPLHSEIVRSRLDADHLNEAFSALEVVWVGCTWTRFINCGGAWGNGWSYSPPTRARSRSSDSRSNSSAASGDLAARDLRGTGRRRVREPSPSRDVTSLSASGLKGRRCGRRRRPQPRRGWGRALARTSSHAISLRHRPARPAVLLPRGAHANHRSQSPTATEQRRVERGQRPDCQAVRIRPRVGSFFPSAGP
jgi:hypothetical protein